MFRLIGVNHKYIADVCQILLHPTEVGVSNIQGSVKPNVNVLYKLPTPNCQLKLNICPPPSLNGSAIEKFVRVTPTAPLNPKVPL